MILITGAAGKTGQAILKGLNSAGLPARVFVRREAQAAALLSEGAYDAVVGDLSDDNALRRACEGVQTIYHICPNMNPDEVSIGQAVIRAAQDAGVTHFVYHSVLHPQVQEMTHHWNKMQVEALLFKSGLKFTILQPASYMQNIAGYLQKMADDGVYTVPYSIDVKFSMVDLEDLAQAAVKIINEGQPHFQAIYELCGAQLLSSTDIAKITGEALGKSVKAVELNRSQWEHNARASGMNEFSRTTLVKMFEYYHYYGFSGNAAVLTALLGRSPTQFEAFLARSLKTSVPS